MLFPLKSDMLPQGSAPAAPPDEPTLWDTAAGMHQVGLRTMGPYPENQFEIAPTRDLRLRYQAPPEVGGTATRIPWGAFMDRVLSKLPERIF